MTDIPISRRVATIAANTSFGLVYDFYRRSGYEQRRHEPGVLDRQAVVLGLARDLAAGKSGELSYVMVDRDEFGPERYRVGTTETVKVPATLIMSNELPAPYERPRSTRISVTRREVKPPPSTVFMVTSGK